jgi:hypothetical protein
MLSVLTIACIFVAAFVVALLAGIGWAFVAVYIPSLLLLNQLPLIPIPHAPMAVQFAPLYAILLAIPFRGESLKFKICSVDIIMFLLLISATITAWTTEVFETGINTLRTDFFTLTAPYLLCRIVFKDWQMRRAALHVLIAVLALISVLALIEFRITPYFYLHVLQNLGMGNKIQPMAYERYGFYRVAGPVEHPIYFGNMCVVILGMVAVLARTGGYSLKNPWVIAALFAAFGCIITSISFTPYMGTIAGTVLFSTLILFPFARKLVLPITLIVMGGLFAYTYHAVTTPLGEKPANDQLGGSQWTRKEIMQECWAKADGTGLFGYGLRPDLYDQDAGEGSFDLKSVDNSYMQFLLTHGWVYVILWISIAFFFAFRMTRAFNAIRHPSQVFPLAVSFATVLALMVSMYTVWAGALYTVIWVMMLGLSNTLIDQVLAAADEWYEAPQQRGFQVLRPISGSSTFRPYPTMRSFEN